MNDFTNVRVDNLVFFNHYLNGDSFINREYIKDLIKFYSSSNIYYAHDNHYSVIQDLPVQQVPIMALPQEVVENMVIVYSPEVHTLFINSWIGCHRNTGFLPAPRHANFKLLHRAWGAVFEKLGVPLRDWEDYHPTVNYNVFDMKEADAYIEKLGDKPLVIVCNGKAMSYQSEMGEMEKMIPILARYLPDHEFLVTHKVNVELPNVTYTDEIFGSPVGNLHHISYISRKAKVVVGKNSGPFSFCHTKENMNDPAKTFVCFSRYAIDTLTGEGDYLCNSVFTSTTDQTQAALLVREYIENAPYSSTKKPTEIK